MIRLQDTILLATAKLRIHRIRLGIIVVVASLLFAAIVFVSFMIGGIINSLHTFGQEGLGSRFIVRGIPVIDMSLMYGENAAIKRDFEAQQKQIVADKKAAAKKLDIAYDPNTDQTLPLIENRFPDGSGQQFLNTNTPLVRAQLDEMIKKQPHIDFASFSRLAKEQGATGTYRSTLNTGYWNGGSDPNSMPSVTVFAGGKEQKNETSQGQFFEPKGIATLTTLGWSYFDEALLTPFLLPGQNLKVGSDNSIPVIAPMSTAEQILGLAELPATATSEQRLERLATVREKIAGTTSQLCYRNRTATELLSLVKEQQAEIARNSKKADFIVPALQYNTPTDTCDAVTVKKDVRSADEKQQTANEIQFKKQFENYEDPVQVLFSIRIVGVTPDLSFDHGFSARSILESLLQSSLGVGWFSPISTAAPGSIPSKLSPAYDAVTPANQAYYAEFSSLEAAKDFAKRSGCSSTLSYGGPSDGADPRAADCYAQGTYFDIEPFGNNAAAVESIRQGIWKALRYIIPAVFIIAGFILMGIVGKIIADSRRETAVFRALGATRFSIAQIYLMYGLFVALLATLVAFLLGGIAAYWLSQKLTPDASVTAVLAYNAQDLHKQFTFFGFDLLYAAIIIGLIVGAALLSTVIPLLTNVRRNPIRDMRDDG